MKKALLLTALMAAAPGVFGQGQVVFNNRLTTGGPAGTLNEPLYAPIYGVNPSDPTSYRVGQGNAAGPGGLPIPLGSTDYSGHPLLSGTGFTAQLWYGAVGTSEAGLVPASNATSTFRTGATTMGAFNGMVAMLPNLPGGPGTRAVFQVRAWDNANGTVNSWAAVLASSFGGRGASPVFSPNFDLGGNGSTPPNLIGMQSFSLVGGLPVPEPSVVAIGLLGAGLLLLSWRDRR